LDDKNQCQLELGFEVPKTVVPGNYKQLLSNIFDKSFKTTGLHDGNLHMI